MGNTFWGNRGRRNRMAPSAAARLGSRHRCALAVGLRESSAAGATNTKTRKHFPIRLASLLCLANCISEANSYFCRVVGESGKCRTWHFGRFKESENTKETLITCTLHSRQFRYSNPFYPINRILQALNPTKNGFKLAGTSLPGVWPPPFLFHAHKQVLLPIGHSFLTLQGIVVLVDLLISLVGNEVNDLSGI